MSTPRWEVVRGQYVPMVAKTIRTALRWMSLYALDIRLVCSDPNREMGRYVVMLSPRSCRQFDAAEVHYRVLASFCERVLNVDVALNSSGVPCSVSFDIYLNGEK